MIKEDLKLHQNSKISEIHKRMGDFDLNYLRRVIYKMYDEGEINRSWRKEKYGLFYWQIKKQILLIKENKFIEMAILSVLYTNILFY